MLLLEILNDYFLCGKIKQDKSIYLSHKSKLNHVRKEMAIYWGIQNVCPISLTQNEHIQQGKRDRLGLMSEKLATNFEF